MKDKWSVHELYRAPSARQGDQTLSRHHVRCGILLLSLKVCFTDQQHWHYLRAGQKHGISDSIPDLQNLKLLFLQVL